MTVTIIVKEISMAKVVDTSNARFIKVVAENGTLGWLAFTAYVGAVIYFFQQDLTVWGFIVALVKAIFWPAYVLFEVLAGLGVR